MFARLMFKPKYFARATNSSSGQTFLSFSFMLKRQSCEFTIKIVNVANFFIEDFVKLEGYLLDHVLVCGVEDGEFPVENNDPSMMFHLAVDDLQAFNLLMKFFPGKAVTFDVYITTENFNVSFAVTLDFLVLLVNKSFFC